MMVDQTTAEEGDKELGEDRNGVGDGPEATATQHPMKMEQTSPEEEKPLDEESGLSYHQMKEEEEAEGAMASIDQSQQMLTDQTEIYRELILRHLIADISGTCTKLGLSTELGAWNGDDCHRWVAEMCTQFQLSVPEGSSFVELDGRRLLGLSVEEFQDRFPDGGDTLHAQLQLWKTAFESCEQPPLFGGGGQSRQMASEDCLLSQSPNEFNIASSSSSSSSSSCHHHSTTPSSSSSSHHHPQHSHFPSVQQHHQPFYSNSTENPSIFDSQVPIYKHHPNFAPHHHHHPLTNECFIADSASSTSSTTHPDDSSSVADDEFLGSASSSASSSTDVPHHHPHPNHHPHLLHPAPFFPVIPSNCAQTLPPPPHHHHSSMHPFCQFPPDHCQFSHPNNSHQFVQQQQQQQIRRFPQQQAQQAIATSTQSHPQQRLPVSHGSSGGGGGTIHLWHFIRELLDQPKEYGACVRWVDRKEGTFKIESSNHLARYWGLRKNRAAMNYDKLSRSLRQYYKKGIIQKPEKKQRLVYKFLPPYNQ